ncbi:hypothetical protein SB780_33895, partial [Burkholderia sp. SIMBA_057]
EDKHGMSRPFHRIDGLQIRISRSEARWKRRIGSLKLGNAAQAAYDVRRSFAALGQGVCA